MTVEHLNLLTGQNPVCTLPFGFRGDAVQIVAAAGLLIGDRENFVSGGDPRKPGLFLLLIARAREKLSTEEHGGEERLRCESSSEGFENNCQIGQAHTSTAVRLGNE